jgi:hypothetical protein
MRQSKRGWLPEITQISSRSVVCSIRCFTLTRISQCAIPAFDRLLPEPHNTTVLHLLAALAEWHALAKLRLHTEVTVNLLETKTTELASRVQEFMNVTCQAYETMETTKEYGARLKRSAKKEKAPGPTIPPGEVEATPPGEPQAGQGEGRPPGPSIGSSASSSTPPEGLRAREGDGRPPGPSVGSSTSSATPPGDLQAGQSEGRAPGPSIDSSPSTTSHKGKLRKTLNLQTYKYHALADYAGHIRRFGTTDSYSTERVGTLQLLGA